MATLDDVVAAKEKLSSRLLRTARRARALKGTVLRNIEDVGEGLHGVGVGFKISNGRPTRTLCVRLYVLKKVPKRRLPTSVRLQADLDGVPTDVIEAPLPFFHASCTVNRRTPLRPLIGGISAAQHQVYQSTFGCFCRSTRAKELARRFMLGCNHSFANMNNAPLGSPILQPSVGDGGGSNHRVARLARRVPLKFGGAPYINVVDAAIAELPTSARVMNEICTIGPLTGIMPAALGMTVRKHGRSSGYTEGTVTDASLDEYVFDYPGGLAALFVSQIRIDPTPQYDTWPAPDGGFAAPGDSGSVVVDKNSPRAVGLHFAGNYGVSIANPIKHVCVQLQITIP